MKSKIELYKQHHASGNFPGDSLRPHVQLIKQIIQKTNSKTILDYGCGKATEYVNNNIHADWNVSQVGLYDPAVPEFMNLPGKEFDGVISTDVLEHIPEHEIDDVLKEIFEMAQKFVYLNIAMYPAVTILPNGENAHCTLKPKEWWNEKIAMHNQKQVYTSSVYDYGNSQRLQIIFDKISYFSPNR